MTLLPRLPLVHNDDGYIIVLKGDDLSIHILDVIRYPHNANVEGTSLRFSDLDPWEQRAVERQVRRRYKEHNILT